MTGEQRGQLPLPDGAPVHDRAFDVLANNTGRALLYLVCSYADEPQSHTTLSRTMDELQGSEPGWQVVASCRDLPRHYAGLLVPAGLLEYTEVSGRRHKSNKQVKALQPGPLDSARSRAMAWTSLDW